MRADPVGPAPLLREMGSEEGVRLTVETEIDQATSDAFYALYLEAFGPLRTRAVARQVLTEDEFAAKMRDARVEKYIGWNSTGAAVGLTTLTRDLCTVPWISPDYFAARYPEHVARGALYYLGFTLVSPSQRRSRLFSRMIEAIAQRMIAERAVCGYDIAAYNNAAFRFADNVEDLLHGLAEVSVERLDTQTYYCAAFSGRARRLD